MCGITGIFSEWGISGDQVATMAATLRHRGPDDGDVWMDDGVGIALGHRRLAIVDLSPAGRQPMQSACGRFILVFNGEIYNHLELRRTLDTEVRGQSWRGHSDTETLLAAFVAWGLAETLKRCVGMFALALWDRKEHMLYLARDRMGEKPLYYGRIGKTFAFASELKALRRIPGFDNPIDRNALALFMQFGYVPAPHSIYCDISKLEPGTTLTVSRSDIAANRILKPEVWWSIGDVARAGIQDPIEDEAEALSVLEVALNKAVAGQMIADVPLGAFLSGGVDSSTLAALMQAQSSRPVKTFTIGFDEKAFDESSHAAAVARHLGTDHHEIRVSLADAQAVIPQLHALYDEPFADSSQIPTFLVCQAARSKVTVALTGDGGDELFGGYNRYFWGQRIWNRVGRMPFAMRRIAGQGIQTIPPAIWDRIGRLAPIAARLGDKAHKLGICLQTIRSSDELYRSLVTEWPREQELVYGAGNVRSNLDDAQTIWGVTDLEQRMMLWDMLSYLPGDILTKVDRAAMGVSLETRVPLLDHRVVELAWRLPLGMKIREGQGKWALRQVLYKHVPRELIERPKTGFAIPVGLWLRGPLRDWADTLLDEQRLRSQGYLDPAPIRERWMEHLSGRRDWTPSLWTVLMFQSWLEQYGTN